MPQQARLPEAFVWWLWETARAGRQLVDADGCSVAVIYPGRRWGSWGPDFRGAVISRSGVVLRGDVEVHVRARDWFAHGHDRDPEYGGTVLHVVFLARGADPGAVPPVLALQPHLTDSLEDLLTEWESANRRVQAADACLTLDGAVPLLRRAGLARLQTKADRFEGDFSVMTMNTALVTGLVEGLGYATNVKPMRALLERVSVEWLRDCLRVGEVEHAAARLFGEAGLLPSQRGRLPLDAYTHALEKRWNEVGGPGRPAQLGWRWLGTRPTNMPVRRVAAGLALLAELDDGLPARVLTIIVELPPRRAAAALRKLLLRPGDPYWHSHGDFGRPLRAPGAVLGEERAADLVVNVILPWALGLARLQRRPELEAAVIRVYEAHPGLGMNQITRHMANQVLGEHAGALHGNACLQQGLIQLYRGWCDARDCATCPTRMVEFATFPGGDELRSPTAPIGVATKGPAPTTANAGRPKTSRAMTAVPSSTRSSA